ncbi:hypothetical protein FRB95_010364 [Tulasnella sp. JGI-2019a]|nr:hypothetical protein FRB95_010364 [Tulasnella sp. JGI-2019a]
MSPDNTTTISGSLDHTLYLWDAKTGAAIGKVMNAHTGWVTWVAMSLDGSTIFSKHSLSTTAIGWNLASQTQLPKVQDHHVKPDMETFTTLPKPEFERQADMLVIYEPEM